MEEKKDVMLIDEKSIRNKIHVIRGQKVMLDVDLAEIYGYETKNFNRQVKNNMQKFEGDDFMFQLTKEEWEILRCKNFTSRWGGVRYLPYVFTEQGIYMLMTVLHGELATEQSRALVRIFKRMKDYIFDNQDFFQYGDYLKTVQQTMKNMQDIVTIKMDVKAVEKQVFAVQEQLSMFVAKSEQQLEEWRKNNDQMFMEVWNNIEELSANFIFDKDLKEFVIYKNQKFEADVAYIDIYQQANKSIYVVDDYMNAKSLQLLSQKTDGYKRI